MRFTELKMKAKEINKNAKPSVYSVAAIFVLVSELLSYLANKLVTPNISQTTLQNLENAAQAGNLDYVIDYISRYSPSGGAYLIQTVITFVNIILSVGFSIFMINTIRKKNPETQNLLDGFSIAGKVILLSLLEGLFVVLWSLLLVVPGIIAAYRYRQAMFLLIDHPDWSVMECIRKSKALMKGHKWELFCLDLSFIWWYILTMIFFPVRIYTEPYTTGTYVLYYQNLVGISDTVEAQIISDDIIG